MNDFKNLINQIELKKIPYYFDEQNEILLINDDLKNIISFIPDDFFDLILTDPPYGIDYSDWDNDIFFNFLNEFKRVLKNNSFFVFWWTTKRLFDAQKVCQYFDYIWQIICYFARTYSKSVCGNRAYTPIFIFKKGEPQIYFKISDVIMAEELPLVEVKVRSGEFKPTLVLSKLIQMFSLKNSIIFDPFMGLGALAILCRLLNRKFIGIEKDKMRFQVAFYYYKNGINKSVPELLEEFSKAQKEDKNLKLF